MSSASCRFCSHGNPPEARFCNQCGSPLTLKPCPHCDAVNDAAAERCYQCDAPFALPDPVATTAAMAASTTGSDSGWASPSVDDERPRAHERAPLTTPIGFAERVATTAGTPAPQSREPKTRVAQPEIPHPEMRRGDSAVRPTWKQSRRAPRIVGYAIALCIVGAAGYYAIFGAMPGDLPIANPFVTERRTPAGDKGDARPLESALPAASVSAKADARAPADVGTTPAGATPSGSSNRSAAVVEPSRPTERSEAPAPTPRPSRDRARPTSPSRDAIETQRLIARELAGFPPSRRAYPPETPSGR